jgi:hypothetical protein
MPQQSSGGGFLSGLMGSVAQGKQASDVKTAVLGCLDASV